MTPKVNKKTKNILWFCEIGIKDIPLVGGKNASLGEMYSNLSKRGVPVPNGFALTSTAYWAILDNNNLRKKLKTTLEKLDVTNVLELNKVSKKVRALVLSVKIPKSIEKQILESYSKLSKENSQGKLSVAVRSSATAEDLPEASFAGQQETYLNVKGEKELLLSIKKCLASLFTSRAISYRHGLGFDDSSVALSVTVQQMVQSYSGASGVMFTLDTESGFQGVSLVTSSYGLGEYIVKGRVTPDQFYVFKDGLRRGKKSIISSVLGSKEVKLVHGKTSGTKQAVVPKKDRHKFSITDNDVIQLTKWGEIIENHYQKPQDIEWAKDGYTGKLYIVQARPETVRTRSNHAVIEKYYLKKTSKTILTGIAVGQKIGSGRVRIINSRTDMKFFKKGEVLVTRITDPDWEPIMRISSAIITEQGGKTSHAAIVSRELGVPCLVGAKGARKLLKNGQQVTVSCTNGDEGVVYQGNLPFEVQTTIIEDIPETKTKIMMNVGDPEHAFALSFLPHSGVGLAREEFIFSNFIRVHPLALLNYNKLKNKKAKKKIKELTVGYKNKADYCVDRLAQGIGRIATAMYPEPAIIRLSDFKTNEYASLIGGEEFEPKEQNPMIGWRGASRYYSKEYKQAFGLECQALKKAREEWGLDNIIVMVPFCRTPEEGEKVLTTMKDFGLERGKNGLEVYVMCEIPSNVILAEEFAKIFDGFSIGSNDLTQLTLGVDRDSTLVSHVYNEKDLSVKKMIREVIRVAHKYKKKIGICGQAPSDYPEFAEFLVREGIDSISLNPDTLVETKRRIAVLEKTLGRKGKKTNSPLLGLLLAVGFLGMSLIGLGAGCTEVNSPFNLEQEAPQVNVSLAEIRKKMEEKLSALQQEKEYNTLTNIAVDSFSTFEISYPITWKANQWDGGVSFSSLDGKEFISIFEQVVGHPVPAEERQSVLIGGKQAQKYESGLGNGQKITVFEIPQDNKIIEINGQSDRLDDLLATLMFDKGEQVPDRPLNQWDIFDKRICVQMITYAKHGESDQCQAFSTPCDVPNGWKVCPAQSG